MAKKKRGPTGGPEGGPEEKAKRKKRSPPASTSRWLWEWAKSIAVAVVLFLVIRTFVVESFKISSGSMETTLLVGDLLLVNKAVYGAEVPLTGVHLPAFDDPDRGDIVVLEPPFTGWEAPYVKRVVGIPGDRVAMRAGVFYLNGAPQTEDYVQHVLPGDDYYNRQFEWQRGHLAPEVQADAYKPTRDSWGPLIVPEGHYFVMGDNRDNSEDSRYWGFVERAAIKGTPFIIYYSFDLNKLRPAPWLTEVRWSRIGDLIR
jgi:signal peptidase I